MNDSHGYFKQPSPQYHPNVLNAIVKTSDGKIVKVNRGLFCSGSSYLNDSFKLSELRRYDEAIDLPIDQDSLKLIQAYLTSKDEFKVTWGTGEKLLDASGKLELRDLKQRVSQFLQDCMNPNNAISIFKVAEYYECNNLSRTVRKYILANFLEIKDHNLLDFNQFYSLIREDFLNVRTEEVVFEAICNWVNHDPNTRIEKFNELIKCVRFGRLTYSYFKGVVLNNKLFMEQQKGSKELIEISRFLSSSEFNGEIDHSHPLAKPRVPNEIAFLYGGWRNGEAIRNMETYDNRTNHWISIGTENSISRAYHGVVSLDSMLYVVGGRDGQSKICLNSLYQYNPVTFTWVEKNSMAYRRCHVACCVLNRKIIAIGGFDGVQRLNTCEVFYPIKGKWGLMKSHMNEKRSDASACVHNNKVYVSGGFDGKDVLNTVEMLSGLDGTWTYIIPMNFPRSGHGMVSTKGKLYVIGGFEGKGRTRVASGECLDLNDQKYRTDTKWKPMSDMSFQRSNFGTCVLEEKIFVFGGFIRGISSTDSVEEYNINTNAWSKVGRMNIARGGVGAVVIKALPNAKDYSFASKINLNRSS